MPGWIVNHITRGYSSYGKKINIFLTFLNTYLLNAIIGSRNGLALSEPSQWWRSIVEYSRKKIKMLKLIIRFLFGERKVLENHKKVLEKSWNFIAQHQWEPCTRFSFLLIYFEYPVLKFLNSLTLLGDKKSEYYYYCCLKKNVCIFVFERFQQAVFV